MFEIKNIVWGVLIYVALLHTDRQTDTHTDTHTHIYGRTEVI